MATMLIISSTILCYYLQYGRSMEIYSSYVTEAENHYERSLIVIANKVYIPDVESCADEIKEKCRNNDFENMIFTQDYSVPGSFHVTVYHSKWDVKKGKPAFKVTFDEGHIQEQ